MRDSLIRCKTYGCVEKTISKMFQFNVARFLFIVIGKFFSKTFYLYGRLLYSYKICYLSFCLGDVTYLSRFFIWLLRRKEAHQILATKSKLQQISIQK